MNDVEYSDETSSFSPDPDVPDDVTAEEYEVFLREHPYWGLVRSDKLRREVVYDIPLELWGETVASFTDQTVNEYLPCHLWRELHEAGYTKYRIPECLVPSG